MIRTPFDLSALSDKASQLVAAAAIVTSAPLLFRISQRIVTCVCGPPTANPPLMSIFLFVGTFTVESSSKTILGQVEKPKQE
ncbi:MAG: hypothetical protein NTU79_14850 [Planctomycetota bacterium]|nr:hypothetical protein [Planctomycetota bacterium]